MTEQSGLQSIPASLDWYRQTTNWLVTISAAAIGFLAQRQEVLISESRLGRVIGFLVTAAFMTVVYSGVKLYTWLTQEADLAEKDPDAVVDIGSASHKVKDAAIKAHAEVSHYWDLMLRSFILGMALVGLIVIGRFALAPERPVYTVLSSVSPDSAGSSGLLLYDRATKGLVFVRADSGRISAQKLRIDTVGASTSNSSGVVRGDASDSSGSESQPAALQPGVKR